MSAPVAGMACGSLRRRPRASSRYEAISDPRTATVRAPRCRHPARARRRRRSQPEHRRRRAPELLAHRMGSCGACRRCSRRGTPQSPDRRPATAGPADSEYREAAPGSARRVGRSRSRIGAQEKREAHLLGSHAVAAREIGRRPSHAEHAGVAAGREPPRPDRLGEKAFGLRVGAAEALHLRHREIRVHPTTGRGETLTHSLSRREDSVADVGGALTAVVAQALEWNARDVNAQVDAIEERTGESPAIPLDLVREARALALGVAPEAAGASVQIRRGNEASNWSSRRRSPNSAAAGAPDESPARARLQTPADDRGEQAGGTTTPTLRAGVELVIGLRSCGQQDGALRPRPCARASALARSQARTKKRVPTSG